MLQSCPARSDEATVRSDEATARSDEATARSDEATAKSNDDEELKRTSRQKLKSFLGTSTRVKNTKRVEAIYPLLKDVALSPDMPGGSNAMKHMFTFALRSARNGIVT
ncbi:hypothetical protein F2Q69_00036925 [Brassica cretica]|uniref:Uncharacterized protein n=1 Tax=Brassica cretica TaxID=69181 RepID=A0A8S9SWE0_BRACR|nr:hypothetical protein F2Q69_00036925 [Brassica cretica]